MARKSSIVEKSAKHMSARIEVGTIGNIMVDGYPGAIFAFAEQKMTHNLRPYVSKNDTQPPSPCVIPCR